MSVAGLFDMLAQLQPHRRLAQELGQRGLAQLDGLAARVSSIKFEQVEGEQHGLDFDRPPVTQPIEYRNAILSADHDLAVEQA
jgi:hypothetical protein